MGRLVPKTENRKPKTNYQRPPARSHAGVPPFAGEEIEYQIVGHLSALHSGPRQPSRIPISLLAQRLATAPVERPGKAAHHVQADTGEGVLEQQVLGFGAIAIAAEIPTSDIGLGFSRSVHPVDLGQSVRANHGAVAE